MERNYDKEIKALKEQISDLQNSILSQSGRMQTGVTESLPDRLTVGRLRSINAMHEMHQDSRLSEQIRDLYYKTEAEGVSGFVTYLGVFNSGGRQSNWIRKCVPIDGLLLLIQSGAARRVLACFGNTNRLAILLKILREPQTVLSLMQNCGFSSAGQVYYHMKPLLAADIVVEDGQRRGGYIIKPDKVQGVIMLLAGISDMVDETYTKC